MRLGFCRKHHYEYAAAECWQRRTGRRPKKTCKWSKAIENDGDDHDDVRGFSSLGREQRCIPDPKEEQKEGTEAKQ
jgi:hypothetical protein